MYGWLAFAAADSIAVIIKGDAKCVPKTFPLNTAIAQWTHADDLLRPADGYLKELFHSFQQLLKRRNAHSKRLQTDVAPHAQSPDWPANGQKQNEPNYSKYNPRTTLGHAFDISTDGYPHVSRVIFPSISTSLSSTTWRNGKSSSTTNQWINSTNGGRWGFISKGNHRAKTQLGLRIMHGLWVSAQVMTPNSWRFPTSYLHR